MKKILLLSMPFGALERQALGISLLKARLEELNISCEVRYFTFTFAEFVGFEEYQLIAHELPYTAFIGDWMFTQSLYGERPEVDREYIQEVLLRTWQLEDSLIQRILRARSLIPHFLNYCMKAVAWENYVIVGFTSTFEQNLSSLSLAKRVKEAYPNIAIVFGGANWEGEMGYELHKKFSFVDYVCSGEADVSFPKLVEKILQISPAVDTTDDIDSIKGIIYRQGNHSNFTGQAELVQQLDTLPFPDFSDYFDNLNQSTVAAYVLPNLLMETSRGCWWGAKSHCTFCGLNGNSMAFRSKSAMRALTEINFLVDHWGLDHLEVVDNILSMRYFDDFIPALAQRENRLSIFFEVKANLSRNQVKMLHEAGIYRIQPGLESLSDHILKLMRKGTSGLRNIQLLKWCKEYHLIVDWNILYGFPGETQEDYDAMLEILPSIRFLSPPSGYGPIRLDRFSPYHSTPDQYGLINVRPLQTYKYLYPFEEESLCKIAYYFDFDYQPDINPSGYASKVIDYVKNWKLKPENGTLSSTTRPDGTLVIIDTRSDAIQTKYILRDMEKVAYEYCSEMCTASTIANRIVEVFPQARITEQQVRCFLDSLVEHRLMVTDRRYYLSLAIPVHWKNRDAALSEEIVNMQAQGTPMQRTL